MKTDPFDAITEDEVEEIQHLHANEDWNVCDLAEEFDVSAAIIRLALSMDLDSEQLEEN